MGKEGVQQFFHKKKRKRRENLGCQNVEILKTLKNYTAAIVDKNFFYFIYCIKNHVIEVKVHKEDGKIIYIKKLGEKE